MVKGLHTLKEGAIDYKEDYNAYDIVPKSIIDNYKECNTNKMKEELLQLFPTPLLIVPYEEPIDKELAYLKTISYREQQQNGNYRSDDSYLLRNEEFKNIKNFLKESIDKFTTNVLNTKQRLVITQCWANRNPKGSQHHEHVHPNSIISGVMYFQINEKLPPIQFSKENKMV